MAAKRSTLIIATIGVMSAALLYMAGTDQRSPNGSETREWSSPDTAERSTFPSVEDDHNETEFNSIIASRGIKASDPRPFFVGTRFADDRVSRGNSVSAESDLEAFKNDVRGQFTSEEIPDLTDVASAGDGEAAYVLYVIYMECSNTLSVPASDAAAERLEGMVDYPANWFSERRKFCGSVDSYSATSEAMKWLLVSADLRYEPAMLRLITMGFYPAFRLASRGQYDAIPMYRAATFRTLSILQDAGVPVAFEVIGTFIANGTFGVPDMKLAYAYLRAHDLMVRGSDVTSLATADHLSRHLDSEELVAAEAMGWEICQRYARGTCQ